MSLLPKWWRKNFLACELIVSIILAAVFIAWCLRFEGAVQVELVLKGNRSAVFGTIASMFGSLLGFVITITSIVIGFHASERLKILRESKQYATMWKVFSSTNRALALSTLSSLLCLIFDKDGGPTPWFYLLCFSSIFSILRLVRSLWILENVLRLITTPVAQAPTSSPQPGGSSQRIS